jgi:hypothetical protein
MFAISGKYINVEGMAFARAGASMLQYKSEDQIADRGFMKYLIPSSPTVHETYAHLHGSPTRSM